MSEDVKVWQPEEVWCYLATKFKNLLSNAFAICIPAGKKALLLIETDDNNEATHCTQNGTIRPCVQGIGCNGRPFYKLIPITPSPPTPAELAAAEKQKAWEAYTGSAEISHEYYKPWSRGYDAHAALQKAGVGT